MMLLRLLLLAVVLFAACAGLVVGARAYGRSTPPKPTYLETGACEQPCWQNIKPGVNTRFEFLEMVEQASPYTGRATDYGDDIAVRFELYTFGVLTLADVLRAYGAPVRVGCLWLDHTTLFPARQFSVAVRLYFAEGLIEVNAVRPDEILRLSPDMQIRSIRYFAPGEPAYPIGETTVWRGFTSARFYGPCHEY